MKKTITIFLLLFLTIFKSYAQYLSLDELINLRGKDADAVNTYLLSKGWVFSDASEETDDSYSNSSWAYGKQLYTGRAKSFCKLMTADGYYNKIVYTTISKDYYNLIKNKIALYKMSKVSSTPKEGYLVTLYVGSNYIVETSLSTDQQTYIPVYAVKVSKRPKYTPIGEEPEEEVAEEDNTYAPQEDEEVLEEIQVNNYKKLINGRYMREPPASEYMFVAEAVSSSCELVSSAYGDIKTVYRNVSPSAHIFVLSRLPKENHEYYFVFSGGYYGYIKRRDIKKWIP